MKWIPLQCPSCRAPLETPTELTQIRCDWCGTAFDRSSAQDASSIGTAPKVSEAVRQLDEQWMAEREEILRVTSGVGSLPNRSTWMGGFIVGGFGLAWTFLALKIGAPLLLALFGVVFAILAISGATRSRRRSQKFERQRGEYRSRRRSLLPHR